MRFRRRGWALAVTGSTLLIGGRLAGLYEVFLLGAVTLVLVLVSAVWVAIRPVAIGVGRDIRPRVIHAGDHAVVTLDVANRSRVTSPVLRLVDPVGSGEGAEVLIAPIAPGTVARTAYQIPTTRRGLVHIGPLRTVHGDAFGIAGRARSVTGTATLTVLPAVEHIRPLTKTAAPAGDGRRRVADLARRGDDFAALRPYVVGDDLRRVHWPSSARTDDLVVRQDDVPWQERVTVVLDTRSTVYPRTSFERAVSAAASIIEAHAARGDQVRLAAAGGIDIASGDDHRQRLRVLEHLAVIDAASARPLAEAPATAGRHRPGAVVVVTGPLGGDDLDLVQRSLAAVPFRRVVSFGGASGVAGRTEVVGVDDARPFALAWDAAASASRRPRRRIGVSR